ncbi:type II and III secretion system protein [Psychrobacter sp. P11G5]|uniref:type II and III secretion system protein n=1 Tax=Psychrobacter sp. P11G5 TaxID=1699624 RepID=UPI000AA6867C|nr:type II and III secretion system protein [Psychrobacter sp. P11G5]
MRINNDNLKVIINDIVLYARNIILALSLGVLPIVVQAAPYQTYVIHTYGGEALLPAVRQQLGTSTDGGTVATYQDKLVLRTTATNYQAVQQLLTQIDGQPQALTVAVRVGNNATSQSDIQQGRVVISNRSIQGAAIINQRDSQQQNNSMYQVQTLSGSAASISTGTLYSLTQSYQANIYPTYNRPAGQIVIQQQMLLPTTQGIQVTPRLLPNGQVEVNLSQTEEKLVIANNSNNQGFHNQNQNIYNGSNAVKRQGLNSTIIVPRGQWVDIGQITQDTQNQSSSYGSNRRNISSTSAPISLLIQ